MIPIFISIAVSSIIVTLIYLNISHPGIQGRYVFSVFALLVAIERIWETFFSTKEKDKFKVVGDWTLVLTNYSYLVTGIIIILEFFHGNAVKNFIITSIGAVIFVFAGVIRFWAMRTLGRQWAIHAVGPSKLASGLHTLIIKGPYKYIRHPIYLGVILEFIGLALIANAFLSIIFILLVSIPLQILRAKKEEKTSVNRFQQAYVNYKKNVPFLIPKLFKIKVNND